MKNTLLRVAAGSAAVLSGAVIISCVCHAPSPGGKDQIVFKETSIFIPGNKISSADLSEMNKILAEYDKSLYRIHTYKCGGIINKAGSLSRRILPLAVVEKIFQNAHSQQLTGAAIQAGRGPGGNSFHKPASLAQPEEAGIGAGGNRFQSPSPHPGMESDRVSRTTGNQYHFNDRELVEKLRPILENYNNG